VASAIDEILKFVERRLDTSHVTDAAITQNGTAGKPKRA
jgi:hypothetical protein